jgi:Mor family transcriptional regulator
MDTKELFKTLDNLVFSQTGKHLDTLQLGILKNVFNGQKYSQIAQEYNCSEGHARGCDL